MGELKPPPMRRDIAKDLPWSSQCDVAQACSLTLRVRDSVASEHSRAQ
jgi:hypothetical protein